MKTAKSKNRIAEFNGDEIAYAKKGVAKVAAARVEGKIKRIEIPALQQGEIILRLIGDRPLMVNNKFAVAQALAEDYGGIGGKTAAVKRAKPTPEQMYINAFYVLPDSKYPAPHPKGRYGVPASGLRKCFCTAIRATGITDNTLVGLIAKSFSVLADCGGLCLIHGDFEKDIRFASIGQGAKVMPDMRYRPIWKKWEIHVKVLYNCKVLSPEQMVNLAMHAGQYVGLCEMRAEKKQGECGGFTVRNI